MRGADQRSEGIFSYVRLEQRVPADHPLRAIRDLVDAALKDLSRLCQAVRPPWPAVDSPGAAVAGSAAAGVLHGALGTAVDGAARLQSVVPLVRRSVDRRC